MSPGRVVVLLSLCWISSIPARAQRYAELVGQVIDPSKAGITDAVVTVVDEDTGFRRQVLTETGGTYAVGSLAPGSYKVHWHALSVDTHTTEGAFTFHVGGH